MQQGPEGHWQWGCWLPASSTPCSAEGAARSAGGVLGSEERAGQRAAGTVAVGRLSSQGQHGRPATTETAWARFWSKKPCMAAMYADQSLPSHQGT